MDVKAVIKSIPIVGPLARRTRAALGPRGRIRGARGTLRKTLELSRLRLSGDTGRRLARGLDDRAFPLADEIEKRRSELLRDTSPLVDESLGPPAIYDEGQSVGDACRVSMDRQSALTLHSLAAEFRPQTILELGTNIGISAAYLASAGGSVTTMDASPHRIAVARRLHRDIGLTNVDYVVGLFDDTLVETLDRLPEIDFAFIDGNHQYQPTLDYFAAIADKSSPGAVLVFDDIRWSDGMKQAWAEIKVSPRFKLIADMHRFGVGILKT